MKLPRRKFLHLAVGAAALPVHAALASALDYPTRPVRIVIGYPAGSGGDITIRIIGQWLSERLGQPFVIENQPGAGSNIAAAAVVRASPDGYTLLSVSAPNTINTTLYKNLDFDFTRDIEPVAGTVRGPLIMEVNPSFPAKTISDFIAYARSNPGTITMASAGNGTVPHMAGELFMMMTGVKLLHVPYRGSPQAITDLLAGRVQLMFDLMSSSIDQVKAGKLRALGVTSATRSNSLPDTPTVGESVPGYEATAWGGIGAPRNTPADIVQKLNHQVNVGLADPKIMSRLSDLGSAPMPMSTAEFRKFIADETEKWAKVIKAANIKLE